jgi:hypothetical protein
VYCYGDIIGEHYFIDKGDGKILELKNNEKELVINNIKYIKESKEYIGILKYTFSKSPSISQEVENIPLDRKSLIRIAKSYHKEVCSAEACIIYEKKLLRSKPAFGPLLGVNALSISIGNHVSDEMYYLQNSRYSNIIYPSIGFYFKVNIPYFSERIYFQYEGTYCRWGIRTSNFYFEPATSFNVYDDISLKQNAYNSLGLIRYEFPKRKFRPVLQVGYFFNYYFKSDYLRSHEVKFQSGNTYYTYEIQKNPFSKLNYGLSFGIGLISEVIINRKMNLDLNYQRGAGFNQNLSTDNILLNLGIQIGK